MASTIITKNGTGSAVPTSLQQGELAINVSSGQLYYGTSASGSMDASVSSSFTFTSVSASGTISASKFHGDGSDLSNVSSTPPAGTISSSLQVFTALTASGNITGSTIEGQTLIADVFLSAPSASITNLTNTNITSSGNISSSGTVFTTNIATPDVPSGNQTGVPITIKAGRGFGSGATAGALFLRTSQGMGTGLGGDITLQPGGGGSGGGQKSGSININSTKININGSVTASSDISASGTLTANTLRLTSTTDASATSTGHAFQSGLTNGANVIIDNNEVMARNNGSTADLHLNPDGGAVSFNNSVSTKVRIQGGHVTASGNISSSGTIIANKLEADALVSHVGDANTGLQFASDTVVIEGNDVAIGTFATNRIELNKPITSSGNISSSSEIFATDFHAPIGINDGYHIGGGKPILAIASGGTLNLGANHSTYQAAGVNIFVTGSDGSKGLFLDTSGNVTASGNISASGFLQGTLIKTDDGANLLGGKRFITDADGYEFRDGTLKALGGIIGNNITASGNISSSGNVTANNFIGAPIHLVTHAWFSNYAAADWGLDKLTAGDDNFGWADRAWDDAVDKADVDQGGGNTGTFTNNDFNKAFRVNHNVTDIELIGILRPNSSVTQLNYYIYKGVPYNGGNTSTTTFLASASSATTTTSRPNDIYITGSTGLQANKGDYIYVFANADLGSGNMKGSYTLTAKIRE